jgi:hypothetical protein
MLEPLRDIAPAKGRARWFAEDQVPVLGWPEVGLGQSFPGLHRRLTPERVDRDLCDLELHGSSAESSSPARAKPPSRRKAVGSY